MRVEIYRNLHNGKLSIRDAKTKHVIGHAARVYLHQAEFKVSQAGRKRVLREKRKNVHAVVNGVLGKAEAFQPYKGRDIEPYQHEYSVFHPVFGTSPPIKRLYDITYNPYRFNQFWCEEIDEPVFEAPLVRIMPEGITAIRVNVNYA